MVRLPDRREAAVFETLHHPELPERPEAIEAPLGDAGAQLLELRLAAGPRQGGVADVVVDVEGRVRSRA
jgi:hypothetical protein